MRWDNKFLLFWNAQFGGTNICGKWKHRRGFRNKILNTGNHNKCKWTEITTNVNGLVSPVARLSGGKKTHNPAVRSLFMRVISKTTDLWKYRRQRYEKKTIHCLTNSVSETFCTLLLKPNFFSGTRQESIGPGGASVPQPQFISLWCQSTSRKRWITIRSKPIVEPLFSPSVIREKMLMCPSSGNWNVKGNLGSAFFLSPSAWGMEHKASSAAAFLQSWHNHEHKGPQANVDGEKIPSKPG